MPSGLSGDQRPAKLQTAAGTGGPPPGQEHLRCPRCDSTNTKFCYYNNYNFSQPRHFCKACRRYWTHGGTLRDVPIGGGTRRNAKRSRTASGGAAAAAMPQAFPARAGPGLFVGCDLLKPGVGPCGNFPSVVGGGSGLGGSGFLGLGGFGLGLGSGFEEMGYGVGKGTVWPFQGVVGDSGGGNNDGSGGEGVIGNTWQLGSGEGGYVSAGDCFSWPDLAISTPAGHVMK